jgi:hypothetical protein
MDVIGVPAEQYVVQPLTATDCSSVLVKHQGAGFDDSESGQHRGLTEGPPCVSMTVLDCCLLWWTLPLRTLPTMVYKDSVTSQHRVQVELLHPVYNH